MLTGKQLDTAEPSGDGGAVLGGLGGGGGGWTSAALASIDISSSGVPGSVYLHEQWASCL